MTEKVVIIGGKGTAVVIAEQIYDAHERFGMDIEVLGFAFDDPAYKDGINGWPVFCGTREAYDMFKHDESVKFVFALYRSDVLKERIALRDSLNIPIDRFLSFRHPSAYVAKSAQLGKANIILANCAINNNVVMGNYNTMQTGSLIGHDTHIGNNNFIAAHTCIGSNLKIGNGNFTGLNCSIKNFVVMGDYNLIGMASNVVKDVSDGNVLIGNPAKQLVK
ncbi:MAG: sialic acid O-acetyltransferase [Bacteroidaceae bacterium]|nr:sialic acid O-acetyltransferase [Bacteroidaceae bacterium]